MAVELSSLNADYLIAEYRSGRSARNIGCELGVTHYEVTKFLKSRGVTIRNKREQGQMGLVSHATEIIALYNSGVRSGDIADKFGCTVTYIYQILKQNGVTLLKGANVPSFETALAEYHGGATVAEIAAKHGCGKSPIYRIFKAEGFTPQREKPVVDVQSAKALFDSGIGVKGVAAKLGCCSSSYLRKVFIGSGIQTRNRSEQQFARMANATPEQRLAWAKPSHDARRGAKMTMEQLVKRAQSRSRLVSGYELELATMLGDRGITIEPQFPIGPYNCDLASHPVAVEVFGGHWHWSGNHLARTEERFRYILNAGWHLLVVAVSKTSPLTPAVADYVAAYIENASRNPSATREYRVIWRAGEYTTAGSLDDDHISIMPPFTRGKNTATGQYQCVPR